MVEKERKEEKREIFPRACTAHTHREDSWDFEALIREKGKGKLV